MTMKNQTKQSPIKGNNIIKILKIAASLKLTVVCLVILAMLVVWGTVYQADNGLYQAQQKFFHSWFFFLFGFIPFPGTVFVMFILFFNLVCAIFFRIGFRISNLGNIVTHLGIIVLLVGGFFTFYFSEESSLMLKEGERSSMSSSRRQWEVAVWERKTGDTDVYAVDTEDLAAGEVIPFDDLNMQLVVKEYYHNCSAFTSGDPAAGPGAILNASGIRHLEEIAGAEEAGGNIPGGIFEVTGGGQGQVLLLYGQDTHPTQLTAAGRNFFFSLRRKKIPLPINVFLKDFMVKWYPNSKIPKSYESRVTIKAEGEEDAVERDVVISMNKPLRFKDYTFFQSSYQIEPDGTEYTVLAVVKNAGRLLPYFSSVIIFLGLVIHFLVMLVRRRKNKKSQ